jgi:tetratricopeptide (TPR) repeat protein
MLLSAIQGITKGSLQFAGKIINNGLNTNNESPELWNALIILYATTALLLDEEQKNILLNKSLLLLEKVIISSPDSVLLYFNHANINLYLKNKDKARTYFLKVNELLKSNRVLFKDCSDLFFPRIYDSFKVEWERVSACYSDQPAQLSGKYKELLFWRTNEYLGDISSDYGDYSEAINYYKNSISSFPDLINKAYTNLGICLNKLERKQEATEAFYHAIKSNSLNLSNYYHLVELLYELNYFEKCIKIINEVLTIVEAIPSFEESRKYFDSLLSKCFHAMERGNNNQINPEEAVTIPSVEIQTIKSETELKKHPKLTENIARDKKLNIFVFCWHSPYLSLLAKTGHNFEAANWTHLIDGSTGWNLSHRPVPENIKLIDSIEDINKKLSDKYYDLAICQTEYDISFVERYDIPVIYLAHNALKTDYRDEKIKMFMVRKRVENFLSRPKSLFVAISEMKLENWNLPGNVITPGIDVNEYCGYEGNMPVIITTCNLFKERNFMMGYTLQKDIVGKMPYQIFGFNPTLSDSRESKNWEELKSFLPPQKGIP